LIGWQAAMRLPVHLILSYLSLTRDSKPAKKHSDLIRLNANSFLNQITACFSNFIRRQFFPSFSINLRHTVSVISWGRNCYGPASKYDIQHAIAPSMNEP
jgi:hypothetical protein